MKPRRCTRSSATSPKKRSRSARASAGSRTSPTRRRCSTSRSTELHRRDGQRQLGPDERPENQRGDGRRRIIAGTAARAKAWAKIDEELVEDAAAIPFDWDKDAEHRGQRSRGRRRPVGRGRVGLRLDVAEVGESALWLHQRDQARGDSASGRSPSVPDRNRERLRMVSVSNIPSTEARSGARP